MGPDFKLKRKSKFSARFRPVSRVNRQFDIERAIQAIRKERGESDCTDSSSSFGDTVSPNDNGEVLDEVQSQWQGDAPHEESSNLFRMRHKKVTAHWRKFVHPLMWRCKWMELQIRKLQSQAAECDRELARYDEQKKLEEQGQNGQSQSDKVMKRKKRKRVEETVDPESYMTEHNFFSYFENNLILGPEISAVVDVGNEGTSNHYNKRGRSNGFSLKIREEDRFIERIITNISKVERELLNLMARVDKLIEENSAKISSIRKLSTQNSARYEEIGNGLEVESLPTGTEMADLLMNNDAVPSHCSKTMRRVTFITNVEDEMLINNEHAREGLHDFEKFRDQFGKKLLEPEREQNSVPSKAKVKNKGMKRKQNTCA